MKRSQKQLCLIPKPKLECGGSLNNTGRVQRVIPTKSPLHMVLKSKRRWDLFKHRSLVVEVLKQQAKAFGIQIYGLSVQMDHIHMSIRVFDRKSYIKFIRALNGILARRLGKGLWKFRPYTRIVRWGRDLSQLNDYIFRNELEVFGFYPYDRKKSLSELVETPPLRSVVRLS